MMNEVNKVFIMTRRLVYQPLVLLLYIIAGTGLAVVLDLSGMGEIATFTVTMALLATVLVAETLSLRWKGVGLLKYAFFHLTERLRGKSDVEAAQMPTNSGQTNISDKLESRYNEGIAEQEPECFVIMPYTGTDDRDVDHFDRVFEDIFSPACQIAGYQAVRADHIHETNMIHLDILQKLLDSPMVLCDLSTLNPNVLFELGLRQAFDKPVVLAQEVGTPQIFDIAPLRYTLYSNSFMYGDVRNAQEAIAEAITATREASEKGTGINSIIKLLPLAQPANLSKSQYFSGDRIVETILSGINDLRQEMRDLMDPANSSIVDNSRVLASSPKYPSGLTQREVEVLRLLAQGKNNREMASELFISEHTVVRHVSNILAKTNSANRAEAALYASQHELS